MHYVRSMAHVPIPQSSLTRQYFESSPSIDIDTDIPKTLFLTQAEASAVHLSRLSYQTPSKQTRQGKESRTEHKDAVRCQAHVPITQKKRELAWQVKRCPYEYLNESRFIRLIHSPNPKSPTLCHPKDEIYPGPRSRSDRITKYSWLPRAQSSTQVYPQKSIPTA
jgi:hypothetical protein